MWPISLEPLGISVPSEVLTFSRVLTTTASPGLADFESSLLSSSALTGMKSAVVVAALPGCAGADVVGTGTAAGDAGGDDWPHSWAAARRGTAAIAARAKRESAAFFISTILRGFLGRVLRVWNFTSESIRPL